MCPLQGGGRPKTAFPSSVLMFGRAASKYVDKRGDDAEIMPCWRTQTIHFGFSEGILNVGGSNRNLLKIGPRFAQECFELFLTTTLCKPTYFLVSC